jgi:hypothetical protein
MTTTRAHEQSIAHKPLWKRQQFWRAVLPVVAVACAALAGILVYNAFVGSNGVKEKSFGTTYPVPPKPKTVKFTDAERAVARKFLRTAVARKDLDQAYAISGPGIRQGMTKKEFMKGTIAVVPYVVNDGTVARMAIDQSYATSAQIEVFLDTKGQRGRIFFMDLIKAKDGKWYVNAWSPRGSPRIPSKVG